MMTSNNPLHQVVLFALVACVAANTAADDHAEVKEMVSDVRADGFDYALETSNSINEKASGDAEGNIHGFYEYVSPEGEHVRVDYVADQYGYHPKGDVLPTPPPIPQGIINGINYIMSKKERINTHQGP